MLRRKEGKGGMLSNIMRSWSSRCGFRLMSKLFFLVVFEGKKKSLGVGKKLLGKGADFWGLGKQVERRKRRKERDGKENGREGESKDYKQTEKMVHREGDRGLWMTREGEERGRRKGWRWREGGMIGRVEGGGEDGGGREGSY